jgi:hypothetical protein
LTVPRALGPVFMFWARESFSAITRASNLVFMFCTPGLIFYGTEGVRSRFHILHARTRFWRYQGCRVPFSSFAPPDSFSAVSSASGPFFMFCAPGLIFGGTEGVESRFDAFRSKICFLRDRGRRVPFSCFAHPDSFSVVPRAWGPVFMFCYPGHVFGCTEGVASCFHVLRSGTRFRQSRVRRVPFSCFARSDSFLSVSRASSSFFMFCAPELIFGCTEGVESRFHVLPTQTRFRLYRGRRVPFSCFGLPVSFSAVPRTSGPVFMFCALGIVFDGTEGVGSRFHVLRVRTHFR